MFISEYIIHGGIDLNSPSQKTANFPKNAEDIFWKFRDDLTENNTGVVRYIEVPVDSNNRMLVKAFWNCEEGRRPVYYCVGFLIPKQLYVNCKEYYIVNQSLNNISLPQILLSFENKQQINFFENEVLPRPSFWTPWQELCHMHYYGESIETNLVKVCLAISVNNIDDWFERLIFAVNPCSLREEYNILLSQAQKEELPVAPSIYEGKIPQDAALMRDVPVENIEKTPNTMPLESSQSKGMNTAKTITGRQKKNIINSVNVILLLFFIANVILAISLCQEKNDSKEQIEKLKKDSEKQIEELKNDSKKQIEKLKKDSEKQIEKLKDEKSSITEAKENLEKNCEYLNQEVTRLTNENNLLKQKEEECKRSHNKN